MLSNEFEHCLNGAFQKARETGHGHLTVEHLLLTLLESPEVREILSACHCDPVSLAQELQGHLDRTTPPRLDQPNPLALDEAARHELPRMLEVQPTLGLQRVLQRAVFHVKSTGKQEVGVANVLVAMFSETQSPAVDLLERQNVTRADVVNYISHEHHGR